MKASYFNLTAPRPKRKQPEMRLQRDVKDYLDLVLPVNACWIPVPNGAHMGAREAAKLIHYGMLRPGSPDLIIYYSSCAYGIELKAGKGARSPAQRLVHERLERAGVPVVVCRSIDDVRAMLQLHNVPLRETWRPCNPVAERAA